MKCWIMHRAALVDRRSHEALWLTGQWNGALAAPVRSLSWGPPGKGKGPRSGCQGRPWHPRCYFSKPPRRARHVTSILLPLGIDFIVFLNTFLSSMSLHFVSLFNLSFAKSSLQPLLCKANARFSSVTKRCPFRGLQVLRVQLVSELLQKSHRDQPLSILRNNERPMFPERETRQACLSLSLLNVILPSVLTKGYWICYVCVCVAAVSGWFINCFLFGLWCFRISLFLKSVHTPLHILLVNLL